MFIPRDDDELINQPRCLFCGEAEQLEIWEIWSDHNYALETCCPALLEHVSAEMHHDPRWARDLLCRLGAEALTGHRLRRVTDGEGSHPMLDWQLRAAPVRFAVARAFIARHYAHAPPPVTWRFGFGVRNGPTLLGVFYGVILSSLVGKVRWNSDHESETHGASRSCRPERGNGHQLNRETNSVFAMPRYPVHIGERSRAAGGFDPSQPSGARVPDPESGHSPTAAEGSFAPMSVIGATCRRPRKQT